jgi:N-acetylmuramoyl-L-alanine amidase
MRRFHRAAAFAVVAVSFGAAAIFAAPSNASEAEAAPTIHFAEHATALVAADFAVDTVEAEARLAHDVDFSNPVAAHAVAPLAEETESAVREERGGRSLAELVADYAGSETPDEQTECLARAVYFESKGEPLTGQLTVAEVIINRAESHRFPSTICDVVRQPSQFSFVRRGHIPQPPRNTQWRTAVAIAQIAMRELAEGSAPDALFFHARHVSPRWRLTRVATVGNHIFYR